MFTILCCADLHGEKVNLEVTLEAAPLSVQDLISCLAHTFAREEEAMLGRPAQATFAVTNVFIYDDAALRWTKLKSITQLHEYDQLYLFQPQTPWHRDMQQDLPPPRPPVQSRANSIAVGTPLPSSSYVEGGTPARHIGVAERAAGHAFTSASLHGAETRRTPMPYATSTLSEGPRVATRSPARAQLAEQRQEEERLAQRLSSVRSERERLERAAQREEAEERRRRAAELDALMQRTEQEIWSHREALAKAEENYQRLLSERQSLVRSVSPH